MEKPISFKRILIGTFTILAIPFIGMQFNEDIQWSSMDFVIAGILLCTTGFIWGLVRVRLSESRWRYCLYVLLIVCVVLLWAEMAVGLFNSIVAGD